MPTGSMPAGTDPQGQPPRQPSALTVTETASRKPDGSLAAELRQGCGPPRDRRSAPGPTPEPFGATAGSMPIKTLAAQIRAFCAAASRWGQRSLAYF
jgi:hypothetical protein